MDPRGREPKEKCLEKEGKTLEGDWVNVLSHHIQADQLDLLAFVDMSSTEKSLQCRLYGRLLM